MPMFILDTTILSNFAHIMTRKLDHILVVDVEATCWQGEPPPLRDDVAAVLATARAEGRRLVAYAGSMGQPNALDTLLDAAALQDSAACAGAATPARIRLTIPSTMPLACDMGHITSMEVALRKRAGL